MQTRSMTAARRTRRARRTRSRKIAGGFKKIIGSRRQVWNGTAKKTKGGLTKTGLVRVNKGTKSQPHFRILSKVKHTRAKSQNIIRRLNDKGYFGCKVRNPRTNKFVPCGRRKGYTPKSKTHGMTLRRRQKGGMYALSPASISGISGTSGAALQMQVASTSP